MIVMIVVALTSLAALCLLSVWLALLRPPTSQALRKFDKPTNKDAHTDDNKNNNNNSNNNNVAQFVLARACCRCCSCSCCAFGRRCCCCCWAFGWGRQTQMMLLGGHFRQPQTLAPLQRPAHSCKDLARSCPRQSVALSRQVHPHAPSSNQMSQNSAAWAQTGRKLSGALSRLPAGTKLCSCLPLLRATWAGHSPLGSASLQDNQPAACGPPNTIGRPCCLDCCRQLCWRRAPSGRSSNVLRPTKAMLMRSASRAPVCREPPALQWRERGKKGPKEEEEQLTHWPGSQLLLVRPKCTRGPAVQHANLEALFCIFLPTSSFFTSS